MCRWVLVSDHPLTTSLAMSELRQATSDLRQATSDLRQATSDLRQPVTAERQPVTSERQTGLYPTIYLAIKINASDAVRHKCLSVLSKLYVVDAVRFDLNLTLT